MASKGALLGQVPIFHMLDAAERTALAAMLAEQHVSAGAHVFEIGEPGDRMYIVCAGAIELSATDHLGQKLVLTVARPGDMFGELSLLDAGPRTANAVALEDSRLLVLGRDALRQFICGKPEVALDMMMVMGQRIRATTERLRRSTTRNASAAIEQKLTPIERVTDWIAAFSGSIQFLVLHAFIFAAWIGWNVAPWVEPFDPYPFGFLTLCVSLEAIFLAVIVLLSQNRQAAKDHIRDDVEYEVNVRAELEVSHLHEKVDRLQAALLARLAAIERRLSAA